MLTEKQERAIQMIATGDYSMPEVANECGCVRQTIYNWMNNKEFAARLDEVLQGIRSQVSKDFTSRLPTALDELYKLCTQTTDKRVKAQCVMYWIDRSLGRITANVNITDERQDDDVDILAFLDDAPKNEGAK